MFFEDYFGPLFPSNITMQRLSLKPTYARHFVLCANRRIFLKCLKNVRLMICFSLFNGKTLSCLSFESSKSQVFFNDAAHGSRWYIHFTSHYFLFADMISINSRPQSIEDLLRLFTFPVSANNLTARNILKVQAILK